METVPEVRHAPIRWIVVSVVLFAITVAVILLSVVGNRLYQQQQDRDTKIDAQAAEIQTLRAQLVAAKKRESDRIYNQCVASQQASIKVRVVMDTIRDVLDGLAASTADQLDADRQLGSESRVEARTQALRRWRRLRAGLPEFPAPSCTQTTGPKVRGTQSTEGGK